MLKTKFKKTVGMGIIAAGLVMSALPASAATEYVWIRDHPRYKDAYQFEFHPEDKSVTVYWKNADGTTRSRDVQCDRVKNGECQIAVEVN